ncbi:hypothetical protein EVAR_90120_1 [Eumeta japonica]|uniref:Uncharacterized protein n=1 Tax=Eumeta variegata TaxID=151549 RepID=A0A4C2A2S7_EUMVA|nr:hypothetical protein EVAR_90120_1 [Eumeta japonica]
MTEFRRLDLLETMLRTKRTPAQDALGRYELTGQLVHYGGFLRKLYAKNLLHLNQRFEFGEAQPKWDLNQVKIKDGNRYQDHDGQSIISQYKICMQGTILYPCG